MPDEQNTLSNTTATGDATAPVSDTPAAPIVSADASIGDAATADDVVAEHPMTIIGEIEELVRLVGNAAVHEYQRIIQRLADLKNHPSVTDASE